MLSRFVASQVKHNSYFLFGLVLGLWVALVAVPFDDEAAVCDAVQGTVSSGSTEDFDPVREQRTSNTAGGARGVTRPRYYSTELGMRGSLLTGVLTSAEALSTRGAALNSTASHLSPALKFFMSARAVHAAPALPNVVGFTDTREMLRPFHVLKYLADNYLDEYDFFFLTTDTTFVNARALTEMVSKLSVSQDVYMGVAEEESEYCTLESGILLSNSVLRAVHGALDWCVRNSYSARHHENVGRCVLHAVHLPCMQKAQGVEYRTVHYTSDVTPLPALGPAITAHPLIETEQFYVLHSYVSRLHLESDASRISSLRGELARAGCAAAWPAGLRATPGPAQTRFDHPRWSLFNTTHEFMQNDHVAAVPIQHSHKKALDLVMASVTAWCRRVWGGDVELTEGWLRRDPSAGVRYKLLLQHADGDSRRLRLVEVMRPLGSARLVPVRYVTESARLNVIVYATSDQKPRNRRLCAYNTKVTLVLVRSSNTSDLLYASTLQACKDMTSSSKECSVELIETSSDQSGLTYYEKMQIARSAAWSAVKSSLSRDALVLLIPVDVEYNEDFLNRVRMNTLSGEQWFSPVPFSRYSQYEHPMFVDANGNKPTVNTGRFNDRRDEVVSFYKRDFDEALLLWTSSGESPFAPMSTILSSLPTLRCIRSPEPGAVTAPRAHPCGANSNNGGANSNNGGPNSNNGGPNSNNGGPNSNNGGANSNNDGANVNNVGDSNKLAGNICLREVRKEGLGKLDLGAPRTLAELLLSS